MKETRTISLNGQAFTIEYDAYRRLRDYLDDVETRMPADQRHDVLQDVEARIAELLQNQLFARHAQVVDIPMVEEVIRQIGQPSEFGTGTRPRVKPDKSQNSGCGRVLGITLKVILILVALQFLIPVLAIVFTLCIALFGTGIGLASMIPAMGLLPLQGFDFLLSTPWLMVLFVLCAVLVIGLPLFVLIYTIVTLARSRRAPKARFWLITIAVWLLSLVGLAVTVVKAAEPVGGIAPFMQQLSAWNDDDESLQIMEQRQVDSFDAIRVSGAIDVTLTQSSGNQVVSVKSNNPSNVVTRVENGVLIIELTDPHYTSADVIVTTDTLYSINATSAADVEIEQLFRADSLSVTVSSAAKAELNVDVTALDLKVSGAGKVELEGQATHATMNVSGAGKVEAEWLHSDDLHINASGASKVEAGSSRNLWVQAAGASKVSYNGNPKIQQSMAVGASSIRHD